MINRDLIASKIKVYLICVCTVYIHYVNINTRIYHIYFENIYMHIFLLIFILYIYIYIYKQHFYEIYTCMCVFI